ncbi:VOC family protein [Paenibacillus alkalitolerans]|uniref:VOC family protein n=1 Tax=Paenibacillus alkalitolerans TaxID=2799335 RepID=UPI0018F61639|nr:VOC family protein [Paenibacillus alkalitolerans]
MEKIVAKVSGIFIPVTDMKRSTEWYLNVFGLEVIAQDNWCTGLKFPGAETIVNLWKVERKQPVDFDAGSYRICYFNFESFDILASRRVLQEKGVEVGELHEENSIKFFDCYDPDGNGLSIVEELPSSPYYEHKQRFRNKP